MEISHNGKCNYCNTNITFKFFIGLIKYIYLDIVKKKILFINYQAVTSHLTYIKAPNTNVWLYNLYFKLCGGYFVYRASVTHGTILDSIFSC